MNCDIAKHFISHFFAFESAYNVMHAGKSGVRWKCFKTKFTQKFLVNSTKKRQVTHWIKHEILKWKNGNIIFLYSINLCFIYNFFI